MSATDGLLDLRRQIDSGEAATVAGIEDRGLQVDGVFPVAGTTLTWARDGGDTDPAPEPQPLGQLPPVSTLAFGSFLAPSWLGPDVTIEQTPTGDAGPKPVGDAQLPFVAVLPPGTPPAGGWPVAVYGHGFTRSTADVLLAAATNATRGIATVATNVVGHGSGPAARGWSPAARRRPGCPPTAGASTRTATGPSRAPRAPRPPATPRRPPPATRCGRPPRTS
jgi:hypothetical protein